MFFTKLKKSFDSVNLGYHLHFFPEIDSTNCEASRLIRRGDDAVIVLAASQTKGRGRQNSAWYGKEKESLFLSLGFSNLKQLSPNCISLLSIEVGISLCRYLNSSYGIPIKLKWPNDLMLAGKKLGGILIETVIKKELVSELVVGIGLNLNVEKESFPEELKSGAISLSEVLQNFDYYALSAGVARSIFDDVNLFFEKNEESGWRKLWERFDYFKQGQAITIFKSNNELRGNYLGIDEKGLLLIKDQNCKILKFDSGEVSLSGQKNKLF